MQQEIEINGFRLTVTGQPGDEDGQVAYLSLPLTSGLKSAKTVRLNEICEYSGPFDIYLNFDEKNEVIGIELI
jgi:hypothetical protein